MQHSDSCGDKQAWRRMRNEQKEALVHDNWLISYLPWRLFLFMVTCYAKISLSWRCNLVVWSLHVALLAGSILIAGTKCPYQNKISSNSVCKIISSNRVCKKGTKLRPYLNITWMQHVKISFYSHFLQQVSNNSQNHRKTLVMEYLPTMKLLKQLLVFSRIQYVD